MSIIIGADIFPSANNSYLFASGDIDLLVGEELQNILNSAKYRVFNLEAPLIDIPSPINKCGPVLRADCNTVNAMKKLNVNLFTLANNHIMDHNVDGLKSTIQTLQKNGISFLGAGKNLNEASKPYVAEVNGRRIGFYACAEREFSIAEKDSPGANPFDALESFDHLYSLKEKCDFIVVLYHGGKEYYRYPSPMLQRVCRKFIEKGANLVICQHSHCIGCEEKFMTGTIVYGQGNFLFDSCKNAFAQTSMLIRLNDDFSIDYLPLVKVEKGVRLSSGENADEILLAFNKRSQEIKDDKFIIDEYKKFAQEKLNGYILTCSGYNHKISLRLLNRLCRHQLTKRILKSYTSKEILMLQNYIECEAHRELWIEGLKCFNKK